MGHFEGLAGQALDASGESGLPLIGRHTVKCAVERPVSKNLSLNDVFLLSAIVSFCAAVFG